MERLIEEYEVKLIEPECAPGSARYGAQVSLPGDISAVFPYLNAIMNNARYDHENTVLVVREPEQAYAFRPREIRIARARDWPQAEELGSEIVERVNRIWQRRDSITPSFTEKVLPRVLDIFKLLPRNNCEECGYATCMAFAADLRQGSAQIEQCPALSDDSRGMILELFTPE